MAVVLDMSVLIYHYINMRLDGEVKNLVWFAQQKLAARCGITPIRIPNSNSFVGSIRKKICGNRIFIRKINQYMSNNAYL